MTNTLGKVTKENVIDKIIELSKERMKYDPSSFSYTFTWTWETEDKRVNREYKEGKITEEDAFLELI